MLKLGASNVGAIESKQNEAYLSERLRGVSGWSCCTSILDSEGTPDAQLAGSVCAELVRYCGYQDQPVGNVPSPFDDPYVGAALITDTGQLIASHRKVFPGEAHAEVYAMCKALMSVDHEETNDTISAINQSFLEKRWLRSEQETADFVGLFRKAGEIVRSAYPSNKLLLLSSLEPCRDFESNPGCSALIAAFAPDSVIYGCDDTNAKGQGRERMLQAGLKVTPNAAVEENLEVNSLFYWAVESFSRLSHQGSLDESFSLRYTLADLTKAPKIHRGDRIALDFSESYNPVYQGYIEPRPLASSLHQLQSITSEKQSSIALFANKLDPDWLAMYLHQYRAVTDSYPSTVAISDSTDKDQGKLLLSRMREQSILVYSSAFRRSIEHAYAIALVCRYEKWNRSCLYMLARTSSGEYKIFQPRAESDESLIDDIKEHFRFEAPAENSSAGWITKLLIYSTRRTYQRLENLFDFWHRTRTFNSGLLSRASIEVYIVCDPSEAPHDFHSFVATLRHKPYLSRVQPFLSRTPSPSHLASRAIEMQLDRLDPIMAFTSGFGSPIDNWEERQAMGEIYARGAQIDPSMIESRIFYHLPEGGASTLTDHWTHACAALNSVNTLGKDGPAHVRARLKDRVKATAKEIDRALADLTKVSALRNHGLFDLLWRYMAALSKVADKASDLEPLVRSPNLATAIGADSFLLRELLLYVCKSQLSDPEKERALTDILTTTTSKHLDDELILQRFGRLAAAYRPMRNALKSCRETSSLDASVRYRTEFLLCTETLDDGYRRLSVAESMPSAICTTLALEGYGLLEGDQILNNVEAAIKRGSDLSFQPIKAWRGDKRFYAHVLIATVPTVRLIDVLRAMAMDEDETVRWACLDVAFSSELRTRCLGVKPTDQAEAKKFRHTVGAIVDSAILGDRDHIWLQREFVSLYSHEHQRAWIEGAPLWTRFTLEDFPKSRRLFRAQRSKNAAVAPMDLHPEVTRALQLSRRTIKRVMLILPPITHPDDELNSPSAANTSTPPLGLAVVASRLAADGHDVTIVDCHRYPSLCDRVISEADQFDWIAFGVVMSTTRSAEAMARNIRVRTKHPFIVFGGHAVTHLAWPAEIPKDSAKRLWDFIVLGDGEDTFSTLIQGEMSQGRWTRPVNVFANAYTIAAKGERCEHWTNRSSPATHATPSWELKSWIDRRMFRDPHNGSFEPTFTRDKSRIEAHVVLARGCDWNCGFCTERKSLSGGERRRGVNDVTEEVGWLVDAQGVQRVQFIDDNILPQIAAAGRPANSQEADIDWARSFLDALTIVHDRYPLFGWRGIFRFEDFWKYEELLPQFTKRLASSGCILLAFGVEHGNEDKRNGLKGASISNAAIKKTIALLRSSGIHTKGYFIIGGRNETPDSTWETINFSTSAGFSLAYYALYKDFVAGISKLSRTTTSASRPPERDELEGKYLLYQEMEGGWDEIFSIINDSSGSIDTDRVAKLASHLGPGITPSRVTEAADAHVRLKHLGFNFDDLIKYNDHHAMDHRSSKQLAEALSFGDRERYFALVRRAYFEFYLRSDFADRYEQLVNLGY